MFSAMKVQLSGTIEKEGGNLMGNLSIGSMEIHDNTFNNSSVIDNREIIQELSELRQKVSENIGSDAAKSVDEMRKAVEEKKTGSIQDILGKLKDEALIYIRDNAPTLLRKFLGL